MKPNYDPMRAAAAAGIPEKVANVWAEKREAAKRPASMKESDARYNLDGPIVSTAEHASWGYIDGLVSPGGLREFLSENKGKSVEININSPGGSCWDANSMVGDLARHEGDVTIVVSGACMSAATFFLAVPNARRVAMEDTEFMVHNCWSFAIGDYRAMEKMAESLRNTNAGIAKKMARATGKDLDEIVAMMDDETWFGDEYALENNFVDEIYSMDDDDDPEDMDEDEAEKEGMDDDDDKPEAVKRAQASFANRFDMGDLRELMDLRQIAEE